MGAARGALEVEPQALDFGSVPVGAEKTLQLTFRNKGSYLLRLEGVAAPEPYAAETTTSTIPVGAVGSATVRFRPSSVGAAAAEVTVTSDDKEAPSIAIPVTGVGIEAAVVVEPLDIDFGEVVWTTQTIGEARTVTVKNPGTDRFDLTAVEWMDDGAGAFSFEAHAAIKTYAPSETGTFSVSYLPNKMGPVEGRFVVRTTAPNGAEIMGHVRGKAVGPVLDLCTEVNGEAQTCGASGAQPKLDFGLLDRGTTRTGVIRVLNLGDRELTAQGLVQGPAGDFGFAPPPATLGEFHVAPGQSQSFDVTHTPSDWEWDSVIVAFGTNAAVRHASSLRVEGRVKRADINLSPGRVTMSLLDASTHDEVTIGIYNCGLASLTINSVALTQRSGPAAALSLQNAPAAGTVIAPQPSCTAPPAGATLTVVFDSATPGTYQAEVAIESSDPIDPRVTATVDATKR